MCYRIFIALFFYTSIYFSQTQAIKWDYVGPKQTTEQVKGLFQSVWVDSTNANYVLAGSACGGLFKTQNALDSLPNWVNITDTYQGINFGISDIVVKHNTNNKTIYVSTAQIGGGMPETYGNGILKTIDGGLTWQAIGPKAEKENLFPLFGLKANPQNQNEMIAYSNHNVYITTNDWETFKKIEFPIKDVTEGYKNWSICDVEFAPFETGKFYVSTKTYNYYEPKLFVCTNFGNTLNEITTTLNKGERIEIATIFSPKYKGKFYIATGWGEVFIQYFNGEVFSNNINPQGIAQANGGAYFNLEFEVNQIDTSVMYIAMTEVSRSLDGGKTFNKITTYNAHNTHADVRAMQLSYSTYKGLNDKLFLANDGGISYLQNCKTLAWQSLNGIGLNANMFWGIDVAQSDTLLVAAGAQDNGNFLIKDNTSFNNVNSCGDGYLTAVINPHSAVGECNAPSLIYWNLKTNQYNYLNVPDEFYDGRRPIKYIDTTVYIGHHHIWRISKRSLENNQTQFEKFADLPFYKNKTGEQKSPTLKNFIIHKNTVIASFHNPNWESNNTGKLVFCEDVTSKTLNWVDLTPIAVHGNSLEICRWAEITTLISDEINETVFYFVSRDVFNQTNSRLFKMNYFIDSNKCDVTEVGYNLPKLGINKLIIDKYSNVMYAALDDGIYYRDLITDTLIWHKLNGISNKLPNVMMLDLAINYATNTLFVSAYGRGIYKSQLVSNNQLQITITKNKTETQPIKIDGALIIQKKKNYTITNKLIICKGSIINLHKGSSLIITHKNLITNENNEPIDLNNFIKKHKTAKIIYKT